MNTFPRPSECSIRIGELLPARFNNGKLVSLRSLDIRFKNPLPAAYKIVVEASGDFVVNTTTANRISTRQPLKLTYVLNETSGR